MSKDIHKLIYVSGVAFRIFSIFLFILNPPLAWTLVFLVDTIDYGFALRAGFTYRQYQYVDKSLDVLSRIYFVFTAYYFNWAFTYLFLILFIVRLVGDAIYLFTKSEKYMFFFPNIIEFFFPLYILYMYLLSGKTPNLASVLIIVFLSAVFKLFHEYLLHIRYWIDPVSLRYVKKHPEHGRILKGCYNKF